MAGVATTIRFGDNLSVTDQGSGAIRVDAAGGEITSHILASWQGAVPAVAGVGAVWRVPYIDGVAVTFTLRSAYARLEDPAASSTSLKIQKSPAGVFVATDITTLNLASSMNEAQVTTGLGTVDSGSLLRISWAIVGSPGSAFTVELEGDTPGDGSGGRPMLHWVDV